MCGIGGILTNYKFDSRSEAEQMASALHHRGPDNTGFWYSDKLVLLHTRLSIIDLSDSGNQPMLDLSGRYIIVFNGEIYNYQEIKETLTKSGIKFKGQTDSEVLLESYKYWGADCLMHLNGMFAFAVWDTVNSTLFLARDRFGEKPLFYTLQRTRFYFASEIKAFWAAGIRTSFNHQRWKNYSNWELQFKDSPSETFYDDIFQLEPGCYATVTPDLKVVKTRYYDPGFKIQSIGKEQAAAQFRELLADSIKLRMRSDVKIGSSLSGGLDSSSIVALLSGMITVPMETFSARFNNFQKDEGKYIEIIGNSFRNINLNYTWPAGNEFAEDFDKIIYTQEEPFKSSSIYAQWRVMELASRKGIKVLLDGQGADEILAGYLHYYRTYINCLFLNGKIYKAIKEQKQFNTLRNPKPAASGSSYFYHFIKILRSFRLQKNCMPSLRDALYKDTFKGGLHTLLRYADRNSMAHSREVRLPFLDHRLVEFVFSLPDEMILKDGWTKLILRESMDQILPSEITWRVDKIGYETPQSDWIDRILSRRDVQLVDEYLTDNHLEKLSSKLSIWDKLMVSKFGVKSTAMYHSI